MRSALLPLDRDRPTDVAVECPIVMHARTPMKFVACCRTKLECCCRSANDSNTISVRRLASDIQSPMRTHRLASQYHIPHLPLFPDPRTGIRAALVIIYCFPRHTYTRPSSPTLRPRSGSSEEPLKGVSRGYGAEGVVALMVQISAPREA